MFSVRHFVAGCALAAISCSAYADVFWPGNGATARHAQMTSYVENFDSLPEADMPAAGLDLSAITVRYAGASTSGVSTRAIFGNCVNIATQKIVLSSTRPSVPFDISIGLKARATGVLLGVCSEGVISEDTTFAFVGVDGTVLKEVKYSRGLFDEVLQYVGTTPVDHIAIHADGRVVVDNVYYETP